MNVATGKVFSVHNFHEPTVTLRLVRFAKKPQASCMPYNDNTGTLPWFATGASQYGPFTYISYVTVDTSWLKTIIAGKLNEYYGKCNPPGTIGKKFYDHSEIQKFEKAGHTQAFLATCFDPLPASGFLGRVHLLRFGITTSRDDFACWCSTPQFIKDRGLEQHLLLQRRSFYVVPTPYAQGFQRVDLGVSEAFPRLVGPSLLAPWEEEVRQCKLGVAAVRTYQKSITQALGAFMLPA